VIFGQSETWVEVILNPSSSSLTNLELRAVAPCARHQPLYLKPPGAQRYYLLCLWQGIAASSLTSAGDQLKRSLCFGQSKQKRGASSTETGKLKKEVITW